MILTPSPPLPKPLRALTLVTEVIYLSKGNKWVKYEAQTTTLAVLSSSTRKKLGDIGFDLSYSRLVITLSLLMS
jgi:hypothetical protein